jgi:hypothetical protein
MPLGTSIDRTRREGPGQFLHGSRRPHRRQILAIGCRVPGSRVIAFATWLLALLGAGLMYVSFDAQYTFIFAQKGDRAAALIEAAMLDTGMVILSALGIGLARAGKPSRSVRFLIMVCAGASAGMNVAAADPASWRPVAAYVAAPVFLAVITDRVIAVIRQHILPPRHRIGLGTAGPYRSGRAAPRGRRGLVPAADHARAVRHAPGPAPDGA